MYTVGTIKMRSHSEGRGYSLRSIKLAKFSQRIPRVFSMTDCPLKKGYSVIEFFAAYLFSVISLVKWIIEKTDRFLSIC